MLISELDCGIAFCALDPRPKGERVRHDAEAGANRLRIDSGNCLESVNQAFRGLRERLLSFHRLS